MKSSLCALVLLALAASAIGGHDRCTRTEASLVVPTFEHPEAVTAKKICDWATGWPGGVLCRIEIGDYADCTFAELSAGTCSKTCMDGAVVTAEKKDGKNKFAFSVSAGYEIELVHLVTDAGFCRTKPNVISDGSLSSYAGLISGQSLQPLTSFNVCLKPPECVDIEAGSFPETCAQTGDDGAYSCTGDNGCQDVEGGCHICTSGGGANGDPHMTGFDNSQFDYNGEVGAVFNVVSTPAFQVNALLMPDMVNGLTYVGTVGIVTASGDRAAVRAAVVEDRLVVEVNDAVVDLQSAGEVAAGDITLQAQGNGDVKVTLPGMVLVVEVHRKIFLNIKNARLTQAHTQIGGVLGETAHANRSVAAGLEHEDSYYFVNSLTTHSFAGKAAVESRKMGSFRDAAAVLGEASMENLN